MTPTRQTGAQEIIRRLCNLQHRVVEEVFGYENANDCFCGEGGFWDVEGYDFRSSGEAVDFIEAAVIEALERRAVAGGSVGSEPVEDV